MASGSRAGCAHEASSLNVIHATSIAVSREHRRAKTDRLDTEHLKRVVLGWLRGEPDHCRMVATPTIEEEDARRPNRERETLIRETTRLVNRMKACLVRFGVRGFDPTLRKAADRLEKLITPEGVRLPPLTLAECFATWRGYAFLESKSDRSRKPVSCASKMIQRRGQTQWCI